MSLAKLIQRTPRLYELNAKHDDIGTVRSAVKIIFFFIILTPIYRYILVNPT